MIATDFDREGELIGLEALAAGARGQPELVDGELAERPARQARPLLGADQGRDRARLRRARRPLLRARLRRRSAPGHRPDLGRDPDPRRLARDPPLRLQLPLRRPRPEPDAGPDRRARARAPRPRRQALLGGVRQVRPSRRHLRGAPRDRQVLGEARGRGRARRDQEPGRGQGGLSRARTRASRRLRYNTTAFTTDASSRLGITPARGDADRRGPLHGRVHLLPAHRQHGLPGVAEHQGAGRSLVRIPEFSAAKGLLDGRADADARQEGDHRPPADLPDPGRLPERARRPQAPRLRAGRPPLPRDLRAADDHRVHARRHRGRHRDLLRPRLDRRRPRLRRDLHLRPLRRRRDPGARGGPEARPRRRPVDRRQGDPAAVADQPGQADRADGGARPRDQGDARRHHPEALRPRLRLQQPARALGDRDRDVQGVPRPRAADGDAGDDRRARARHGPDRRRQDLARTRSCGSAARCSTARPRDLYERREDLAK